MEAFTSWIEKHVAPVAGKLGANRYIQSIQNTFLTLVPFMTIGSLALVIVSPPMDYESLTTPICPSYPPFLKRLIARALASMRLYIACQRLPKS